MKNDICDGCQYCKYGTVCNGIDCRIKIINGVKLTTVLLVNPLSDIAFAMLTNPELENIGQKLSEATVYLHYIAQKNTFDAQTDLHWLEKVSDILVECGDFFATQEKDKFAHFAARLAEFQLNISMMLSGTAPMW